MKITEQELESALDAGKSMNEIAQEINVSMSTIKYWCKKWSLASQYGSFKEKNEKSQKSYQKGGFKNFRLEVDESHLNYQNWNVEQKKAYSYLLGFYLGDGHLQYDRKRRGRSYTFVISNQESLKNMNKRIFDNLKILFPSKNVRFYKSKKDKDCIDIKVTGICLNFLFPHGDGKKHTRKIELIDWQNEIIFTYPKEFIKGMIESDGCRFAPRKKQCPTYIIYQFSNCSLDLHNILQNVASSIGLEFTFRQCKTKKHLHNCAAKYWTSFNKKASVNLLETFIGPKD